MASDPTAKELMQLTFSQRNLRSVYLTSLQNADTYHRDVTRRAQSI